PDNVVADEEIEVSIIVIIHKGSARPPGIGTSGNSCSGSYLDESAVTIFKQTIFSHGRKEKVDVAIIVVISRGHPHSVEGNIQSRFNCYIGKGSFSVVGVKSHRGVCLSRDRVPLGRVHKEQVLVTVTVVVKKSNATAHRLRKQLPPVRSIFMNES